MTKRNVNLMLSALLVGAASGFLFLSKSPALAVVTGHPMYIVAAVLAALVLAYGLFRLIGLLNR